MTAQPPTRPPIQLPTRRPARKSLQARLALAYAAGIYAAGVFVLLFVDVPLADVQSTVPKGGSAPSTTVTGTGPGISLGQLLMGSAVALAVLIPVALALGWFIAGRFLHPLRAITSTARAISAGNLHRRLSLGEPVDELTELGHTLDDLFARLQASFDAQRHFVANASHELRTPLAGLRTLLEVALADPDADAETLRTVCQEALALGGHQERLVRALLVLATSERGISRWETCDLAQIAGRALASRRDQAVAGDIGVAEHLAPAVTAGDPKLIESLMSNLVDNAIRYNYPGGRVVISTKTSGSWVSVTVANSGPVVPGDQLQRLFQPFERLSPDRGDRGSDRHDGHDHGHDRGYGLGLAIISAVAQAHHAGLTAQPQPEGGLAVTARFAHVSQLRHAVFSAPEPQRHAPQAVG